MTLLEEATRILEYYTRLLKEGESSKLIELYPKAINALGTILNTVSSMHQLGVHKQCSPPLLVCASFLELEGMPIRASALYVEAGDCLFAEGYLRNALECFLKGYRAASSKPSKAGKTFSSIALLMAAFTALKLEGPPLFKETIKQARNSVDKKTWGSIRRTKYYALLRILDQAANTRFFPQKVYLLQVLDELSSLAVGNSLREWFRVTD
ncbi:MAG: hypothetical protein QXN15_01880 [Candidatus Jordarchaeales archaeon]|nr:hypothetical protein [Candidatus Jordarchaeia archaeon]